MSYTPGIIHLAYEKFYKGKPVPNGLLPKYYDEWIEGMVTHPHQYNVLTRYYNSPDLISGFFPVLSKKSSYSVNTVHVESLSSSGRNWLVVEPSSIDKSFVIENCIATLSSITRRAISDGLLHLIIYYAIEAFSFEYREFMSTLERTLAFLNLPPQNVTLIFGDQNISLNYERYCNSHFVYYAWAQDSMVSFDHFEIEFRHYIDNIRSCSAEWRKQYVPEHPEIRNTFRPYSFLCLNGGARKHRRFFVAELFRRGLGRHGLISYLSKYFEDISQTIYLDKNHKNYDELLRFHSEWEQTKKHFYIPEDIIDGYWHNRGMLANHYMKSYFSVVMETYPDLPAFFLTEKVFKPIFNLHPFIIVGACGSLNKLRKSGYETFPELFDESYDEIEDDRERFEHILQQIERLTYSMEQLHKTYTNIWLKLLRNRHLFLSKTFTEQIDCLFKRINR